WDLLTFRNQRVCSYETIRADLCAAQDRRAHTYQREIADGRGMHDDLVSDGDMGADNRWLAWISVDDGIVLHIRIFADLDPLIVAAEHGTEPDARMGSETYFADHTCVRSDPVLILTRKFWTRVTKHVNRHSLALLANHQGA